MSNIKTKGKGLSSTTTVDFEVKPPFQIMDDNRRRFIRIDIDEPISFSTIKSPEGGFWKIGEGMTGTGEILNISAGGVLMFCKEPVLEGAILAMSMKVEGAESLDNILGIVKRTEIDSGGYLIGIESISREQLRDTLSEVEITSLPENAASFADRLRSMLARYIYSKKLSDGCHEQES